MANDAPDGELLVELFKVDGAEHGPWFENPEPCVSVTRSFRLP